MRLIKDLDINHDIGKKYTQLIFCHKFNNMAIASVRWCKIFHTTFYYHKLVIRYVGVMRKCEYLPHSMNKDIERHKVKKITRT